MIEFEKTGVLPRLSPHGCIDAKSSERIGQFPDPYASGAPHWQLVFFLRLFGNRETREFVPGASMPADCQLQERLMAIKKR